MKLVFYYSFFFVIFYFLFNKRTQLIKEDVTCGYLQIKYLHLQWGKIDEIELKIKTL